MKVLMSMKSRWKKSICNHPEHNPPSMISVPPGATKTHTCPKCGKKTIIQGSLASW